MKLQQKELNRRRAGFTLMEMLVVVAIIVALAGIGGYYLMGALTGGQKDVARTQVKGTLTNACQAYYLKHSQWPDTLQQLTVKDDMGMIYLENQDALLDPWKKPYQYDKSGQKNNQTKPDIYTTAPDGEIIGNWPSTTGVSAPR